MCVCVYAHTHTHLALLGEHLDKNTHGCTKTSYVRVAELLVRKCQYSSGLRKERLPFRALRSADSVVLNFSAGDGQVLAVTVGCKSFYLVSLYLLSGSLLSPLAFCVGD